MEPKYKLGAVVIALGRERRTPRLAKDYVSDINICTIISYATLPMVSNAEAATYVLIF